VCTFISLRHAKAEFERQSLDLGRQLSDLAKANKTDTTTIVFNGQKMLLGSSATDAPVNEVLNRYEAYCRDKSSAMFRDDANAPKEGAEIAKSGVIRANGIDEGSVICFVQGSESRPTRKEALDAFIKSGNLGAIGELRYAYVKKSETGRALVLTAWTDSTFNLLAIAPRTPDTDVVGEDFSNVPRLGGTVRTMSARAEGTPYAVNVYRTKESPEKVAAFYDKEMQDKGWYMFDPERNDKMLGKLGRGYIKDGVVVTMNTLVEKDGTFFLLGISGVGGDDEKIGKIK
jgi:hypothetical protein